MIDDSSILGSVVVYRRIQPAYLDFDTNGNPVMSDGAFRTRELSVYRSDRVTPDEVLNGYPHNGLAELTVQAIRNAGCIVVVDEPPQGHLVVYRADDPGKRISSASATKMARAARWIKLPTKP
jgi:hypothetical protein